MRAHIVTAVFMVGFVSGVLVAAQKPEAAALTTERVAGIGGVFFKARDPKALGAWYRDKLGVPLQSGGEFAVFFWREREEQARLGTTVWSLFPSDTRYFGPGSSSVMVNYRVQNLDRMLAQLRGLGVKIDPKVTDDFNGKFAWAFDPEGNKIELWEPKAGF